MLRTEILVEHYCALIFLLAQEQEHLAEDWELLQRFTYFSSSKLCTRSGFEGIEIRTINLPGH